MTNKIETISQSENNINASQPTAIIYSIDDLSYYHVEIRHHQESYLLKQNDMPLAFHSIAEAKKAAVSHGAVTGYLALSTTYHEPDKSNDIPNKPNHRYDYVRVDLAAT